MYSPFKKILLYKNSQGGYIALMSVIIICLILLAITSVLSMSNYFSRFNVLDREYKRVSLGLAESCVNMALLRIAQNPNYTGNERIYLDLPNRCDKDNNCCYIKQVSYDPASGYNSDEKIAKIATQAQFPFGRGAVSNMEVSGTVQGPNDAAHISGRIIVFKKPGGPEFPSDFPILINTIPATSGEWKTVLVNVEYTLTTPQLTPSGYTTNSLWGGDCASDGTITIAESDSDKDKSCDIYYYEAPTTAQLTLVANVTNDNNGIKQPGDFRLTINGTSYSSPVTLSDLAPQTYFLGAVEMDGYTASLWGGDSGCSNVSITLNAGDNKTCEINYDDDAPPAPDCADTVMIFDRTNTTRSYHPQMMKAGKALLDLYKPVSPTPQVGIGDYGDLYGDHHHAEIPTGISPQLVSGLLTSNYGGENSITPAPNNTGTLVPTGEGNYTKWGATGTTNKTAAVLNNDSDIMYISETTNGEAHTFKISNAGLTTGSVVNSVTLYAIAAGVSNPTIKLRVEKGTRTADLKDNSVSHMLTDTNYSTIKWEMAVNPFTNLPWALSEVNAWTTRFGVVKTSTIGTAKVTQIYVVVNYTGPVVTTITGLYKTMTEIYSNGTSGGGTSNLSDGVRVGNIELNRTTPINGSSGHKSGFEKVLIFVADGKPDYPDNSINRLLNESDIAKQGGTKIFSIYFGSATLTQRDVMAHLASGTYPVSGHALGSENNAGASTVQSVIDAENNDGDYFFISPTAEKMAEIVTDIGKIVCPAAVPPPPLTTAKLNVVTNVINDNAGTSHASDFHITISGANALPNSFNGSTSGVLVNVDAGSHFNITQDILSGYSAPVYSSSCYIGTVTAGNTVTCVITNDDVAPVIPPPPPLPNIQINAWGEVDSWTEGP